MGAQPDGLDVPPGGPLPPGHQVDPSTTLSAYLHVPFCTTRCGYCDFNTYTATELGEPADAPGLGMSSWLHGMHSEIDTAASQLHALGDQRPLGTVFVGGGTPSLVPADDMAGLLDHLRTAFGLAADAEVTTEANPESTTPEWLEGLRAGGFNRLSLGMQSAKQHVLALLERQHTPGRALQVVQWAREQGFDDVSLDLIMGTPGESSDDFRASLEAVIGAGVDHTSVYSLIVEEGTRFAAKVRRGEIPMPSDDDHAETYLLAEQLLTSAGFENYEVSNWARPRPGRAHRSVHNLAYWRSQDWWGFGPGAHSHVNGVRWWNHKHPTKYTRALAEGAPAAVGHELLTGAQRHEERVLLELRIADGMPLAELDPDERSRLDPWVSSGHAVIADHRVRLTLPGRLLADGIVLDVLAG
ncbi:radical SAM family heme chaperone HemW [Propionibacteriaceae bacterium G57]|uniref:radical SAM family heme chaperone HemW n=1 Tax=Aestuariimicrobium sp. G57 TaxID=3418485 RepID=UPI003DA74538